MNKHIELVKKWLTDKDSVSQADLKANVKAASNAAYDASNAAKAAADAAYDASNAAYDAADATSEAIYWVERYEEMTNE